MSWELIDHTGDIGVAARAPTFEALLAECARAMFSIVADAPASSSARAAEDAPSPSGVEEFPSAGADPPGELRDFLAELLYRFSAERKMYVGFIPGSGSVRAAWEPYDPVRHPLKTELKAVTYHQLEAVRENDGWRAQVIFDL